MPRSSAIVADVGGQQLDLYLRRHVFDPLGMTDTDLLRSELVRSRLATGYRLRLWWPRQQPPFGGVGGDSAEGHLTATFGLRSADSYPQPTLALLGT